VIKKSHVTVEEAAIIHESAMLERHYQTNSMFIPHVSQHLHKIPMREGGNLSIQMLNEVILGLSEGRYDPEDIINSANVDLKPNTDDNPFFYKMTKAMPEEVSILLVLGLILTVTAVLIKPSFRPPKKRILYRRDKLFRSLFFLIGVGFMLVEIPLIQKFTLFLGRPVYSLSVLLFSVLVGAGIGSYLSERIRKVGNTTMMIATSLIVAILITIYVWLLPIIVGLLLGKSIFIRIVISAGLFLPAGLVIGVPFPTGIRMIHSHGMTGQVPRMWAINGFSSVFGSVLAIALAINWSLNSSLMMGALFYFLVATLFLYKRNLLLD